LHHKLNSCGIEPRENLGQGFLTKAAPHQKLGFCLYPFIEHYSYLIFLAIQQYFTLPVCAAGIAMFYR
jgi:hypothetical protein